MHNVKQFRGELLMARNRVAEAKVRFEEAEQKSIDADAVAERFPDHQQGRTPIYSLCLVVAAVLLDTVGGFLAASGTDTDGLEFVVLVIGFAIGPAFLGHEFGLELRRSRRGF